MLWDGNCGFCKYWIIRWKKITGNRVAYQPYHEALPHIRDIPEWACREAVRLIDVDGTVYNGPEAAYKALHQANCRTGLLRAYTNSDLFRYLSDHGYMWIAKHRNRLFAITRILWGNDPTAPKKYWLYYLLALLVALVSIFILLAVT